MKLRRVKPLIYEANTYGNMGKDRPRCAYLNETGEFLRRIRLTVPRVNASCALDRTFHYGYRN